MRNAAGEHIADFCGPINEARYALSCEAVTELVTEVVAISREQVVVTSFELVS